MRSEWTMRWKAIGAVLIVALLAMALPLGMAAQDDDDPPGRAARLGHIEGSVSFQPAGESEWVEAVPNRPMTTGDKIWSDKDSRAEVELGPTSIRLSSNSGMSFLNLDDRTVQIQVSSGTVNLRVRRMNRDDVFEVDTPNQAFSILQEGSYRVEASEDGNYTVVTVRHGEGEATGNGQTYTSSALKISTTTATGSLRPSTAMYGIRGLLPDGLLITKAIGPGWILGGGHGWMMHPGVMLPLTTDAGPLLEAVGDGYQAQWK